MIRLHQHVKENFWTIRSGFSKWIAATLFLFFFFQRGSAQPELHIRNINDPLLSQRTIHGFWRHEGGFLWIATDKGLLYSDGQFLKEQLIPGIGNSSVNKVVGNGSYLMVATNGNGLFCLDLSRHEWLEQTLPEIGNTITDIQQHRQNSFWLTSERGLFIIHIDSGIHRSTRIDLKLDLHRPDLLPTRVFSTNSGRLWLIDHERNLYMTKEEIHNSQSTSAIQFVKKFASINAITFVGTQDQLWIAADNDSIYVYSHSGKLLKNYSINRIEGFSGTKINSMAEDHESRIWISTYQGILIFDQKQHQATPNIYTPNNLEQSPFKNLDELFRTFQDSPSYLIDTDSDGAILFVSYWRGIFVATSEHQFFKHFPREVTNRETLTESDVSFPFVDKDGNMWIGTWGGGLHYASRTEIQKRNPVYRKLNLSPERPDNILANRIFPIVEDGNRNLWIGTSGDGLVFLDAAEKYKTHPQLVHVRYDKNDPTSLPHDSIRAFFLDVQGALWIGTQNGLGKLDITNFRYDNLKRPMIERFLTGQAIMEIKPGRDGNLWLGTQSDGLIIWDPKLSKPVKQIRHYSANGEQFEFDRIYDLEFDDSGKVWIATYDGLISYAIRTDTFRRYTERDGLSTRVIQFLRKDKSNRIWAGTFNGLTVLDQREAKIKTFFISKGGLSNSFTEGTSVAEDGAIYFGSRNGFYRFYPDSARISYNDVHVGLTAMEVQGISVPLSKILYHTQNPKLPLTIENADKVISIEFSAFEFKNPDDVTYSYRLLPVEDKWVSISGSANRATYSHLNPGLYQFEVRANHKGELPAKSTILFFKIKYPWWLQWWSMLGFLFVIIFAAWQVRRIRQQRKKLEQDLFREHVEKDKIEKLQQMKMQFFTYISHEFKTPLSLIKAPVERLLQNTSLADANYRYLSLIKNNTERLSRLINHLIDLQKISQQKMEVKMEVFDWNFIIEETAQQFVEWSLQQHVHFCFHTQWRKITARNDKEKIESILYNLLSNAFKNTPHQGSITIDLATAEADRYIVLTITNTGSTIPPENLPRLFEPFYSKETVGNGLQKGSGVGLALVKAITEMLGGTIEVKSELNSIQFVVSLPCEIFTLEPGPRDVTFDNFSSVSQQEIVGKSSAARTTVLIAEDNPDLNEFLRSTLSPTHNVIQAWDGATAWSIVQKTDVDLLLSDWMMAGMDGEDLCRNVKTTLSTSHIPVIILTAKTDEIDQISGVRAGADAYITKPFSAEYLITMIGNLLSLKNSMRNKFSKEIRIEATQLVITPVDEQFLNKAIRSVESNIDNEEFSVEDLANDLALSSAQTYRKLKGVTGLSPVEFIRNVRLKRAAQLLKETNKTVSEISYQVGFSNPKYFSKCFAETFEMTPTDFRNQSAVSS